MVNPFKEISWKPDIKERRTFARSLIMGFPCVAILMLFVIRWRTGVWDVEIPIWVAGVGIGLGFLLYLIPGVARPFYLVWYAVACSIGLVVGNVLLAFVYYTVVTLIGVVKRTTGRGPIRKKFDKSVATYWVDAEKPKKPERYFSQF